MLRALITLSGGGEKTDVGFHHVSCGCITGIMFHDGGSGVEGWKNGWKANVTNGGGGCGTAAGVSGPGRNWGKMPGAETLFLLSVRYCAALLRL